MIPVFLTTMNTELIKVEEHYLGNKIIETDAVLDKRRSSLTSPVQIGFSP